MKVRTLKRIWARLSPALLWAGAALVLEDLLLGELVRRIFDMYPRPLER